MYYYLLTYLLTYLETGPKEGLKIKGERGPPSYVVSITDSLIEVRVKCGCDAFGSEPI